MDDINTLNIPAYKRKRSISARARRKPSYTIKPAKKTRRRTTQKTIQEIEEIPIQRTMPSEELFPSPVLENEEEIREMKICGTCDGYFDQIDVAVIQITSALRKGDRIIFETNEGLFEQTITSMQINRKNIALARAGSDIGLKVLMKPKVGGYVYKVI